jgi:hypothetical protein
MFFGGTNLQFPRKQQKLFPFYYHEYAAWAKKINSEG